MDSNEYEGVPACIECGAIIPETGDPPYQIGAGSSLCHECALRRNGRYDEHAQIWAELPDLAGLELPKPSA
jgi:hypothetical protein